jgi:hypothetical protein
MSGETYTRSQTGAIATLLAAAVFGVTATGGVLMSPQGQPPSALVAFVGIIIIAWLLIPLYAKRIKWSYIAGIIVMIIGLVGLAVDPGTPPWYAFGELVYDFSFVIFYVDGFAGLYFSYKSYTEVQ